MRESLNGWRKGGRGGGVGRGAEDRRNGKRARRRRKYVGGVDMEIHGGRGGLGGGRGVKRDVNGVWRAREKCRERGKDFGMWRRRRASVGIEFSGWQRRVQEHRKREICGKWRLGKKRNQEN